MGAVEVSKIYETVLYLKECSEKQIQPTDVNYNQFERNVYNSWLVERYGMVLQNLHTFMLAVGGRVYEFSNPKRN